jgi:hypothetical protein
VYGAELVERRVGQRANVVELRHVCADADHLRSRGGELLDGAGQRRPLHVGEREPHPLGREPTRDRAPDAARATGDHRDLAPERTHRR